VAAFVIGIASSQDVDVLEKMLGSLNALDRSKFVVITTDEPSEDHDDSFINFVHTEGDDRQITGDGGMRVPGLELGAAGLGYLSHPHFVRHVGTLPIPDDEADNYNDAIEAGRSVVAYPADGDSAQVEAALKSCGLAHVKTF
jgi:hypothetical protein